jgi:hypothetical protein
MCHLRMTTCFVSWLAGDGAATIAAAVIGALVVVAGYFVQQRGVRRERRAVIYSEAIRAVEDYLEAPFLVIRRQGRLESDRALSTHISNIQSRIAFHRALLKIDAPTCVMESYEEFVRAARAEAGPAMTAAWKSKPLRRSADVPLGRRFSRTKSDAALEILVRTMR